VSLQASAPYVRSLDPEGRGGRLAGVWSTIWEAVGAVGTVAAVLWAVFTTIHERRKRTDAENRLALEQRHTRDAERRGQANRIVGWIAIQPTGPRDRLLPEPLYARTLHVANNSDSPAFDVRATVMESNVPLGADDKPLDPDDVDAESELQFSLLQTPRLLVTNHHWPVLPSGVHEIEVGAKHNRPTLRLRLCFRDAAGVEWLRTSDGTLKEVQPDTAVSDDPIA
jgi:hypothetical protein